VFPLKDNIPTDRFPVVTVAFLIANVVVYFFLQKHFGSGFSGLNTPDNQNVITWSAIPYEITNPGDQCDPFRAGDGANDYVAACEGAPGTTGTSEVDQPPTIVTAFSSMFMHGGLLHLGGNMLFLWIFGNNVEDAMGRLRFVVFYVLGGLAALGLQVAIDPGSTVPTLGASGAIAAVLGGYLLLYPRARVLTAIFLIIFFTLIEIPALVVLGFWFAQQVLFGALDLSDPTGGGGVAYFAHIGGFVFGLVCIKLFTQRVKRTPLARRSAF
jgi:membrane associated rhomboid family serine protease